MQPANNNNFVRKSNSNPVLPIKSPVKYAGKKWETVVTTEADKSSEQVANAAMAAAASSSNNRFRHLTQEQHLTHARLMNAIHIRSNPEEYQTEEKAIKASMESPEGQAILQKEKEELEALVRKLEAEDRAQLARPAVPETKFTAGEIAEQQRAFAELNERRQINVNNNRPIPAAAQHPRLPVVFVDNDEAIKTALAESNQSKKEDDLFNEFAMIEDRSKPNPKPTDSATGGWFSGWWTKKPG